MNALDGAADALWEYEQAVSQAHNLWTLCEACSHRRRDPAGYVLVKDATTLAPQHDAVASGQQPDDWCTEGWFYLSNRPCMWFTVILLPSCGKDWLPWTANSDNDDDKCEGMMNAISRNNYVRCIRTLMLLMLVQICNDFYFHILGKCHSWMFFHFCLQCQLSNMWDYESARRLSHWLDRTGTVLS